jgi:hypothetical protein
VDSEVRTGVTYEVRDGWRENGAATEKVPDVVYHPRLLL